MRNVLILLALVFFVNTSFAQKFSVREGFLGGFEVAVGKNRSNQVFNFNRNMAFVQPVSFMFLFNNKFGILTELRLGFYLKDLEPENVKLPSSMEKDVYIYRSEYYMEKDRAVIKPRLGVFYNLEHGKWAFQPKLLAGKINIVPNSVNLTLKEKDSNIYYSDLYDRNNTLGGLNLFSLSAGMSASKALSSRFSVTAEALYTHSQKSFYFSREVRNLYTNEESFKSFHEQIRFSSVSLGIGCSIKFGRRKTEKDPLPE